jgi:hypothetical protein
MVRLCSMQRRIFLGSATNLFVVTLRLAPRMMRDRRGFNVTRANCRPAIRQANKRLHLHPRAIMAYHRPRALQMSYEG